MKYFSSGLIFFLLVLVGVSQSEETSKVEEYANKIADQLMKGVKPVSDFFNKMFQRDVIDAKQLEDFINQVRGPTVTFVKAISDPFWNLVSSIVKKVTVGSKE